MSSKYSNNVETLIIFGTYKIIEICLKSLESLTAAIKAYDVKLIVSDGTPDKPINQKSPRQHVDDFVWTPKLTNMATSRNIALRLAQDKYTSVCYVPNSMSQFFKKRNIRVNNLTQESYVDFFNRKL